MSRHPSNASTAASSTLTTDSQVNPIPPHFSPPSCSSLLLLLPAPSSLILLVNGLSYPSSSFTTFLFPFSFLYSFIFIVVG